MENRGGIRVTLERLAGDFILRTMRSHGETKKEEMWQHGQTLWQIYAGLGGREVLEETGGREAG